MNKQMGQLITWTIPNFFAPISIGWLLCFVSHDISIGGYIIRVDCWVITASLHSTIALSWLLGFLMMGP